jgi:hypothetical protein
MKSLFILLCCFIFMPCWTLCQNSGSYAYIKVEQFKIAKVTLGSDLKAAEKAFGKADSIEAISTDKIDSVEEQWYYFNGITALVSNNRISRLECVNPKYKTPQGIKVGDATEKLFKTLGKSEIWNIENRKSVQYALWPPCDLYMIFELDHGKISRIILDYIP